jgi:DNA invertase Pin-like site-specific DNA recombinase
MLRAEAKHRGWDLTLIADEGLSSKNLRRPGLTAALTTLAAGEADLLVVTALDRLSRSFMDIATLMQQSAAQGWAIRSIRDRIETDSAMRRAYVRMAALFAELERGLISERVKAGMAQRLIERRAIDPTFRFGRPNELDDATRDRIISDNGRGLTCSEIARNLAAEGVPTARGGPNWFPATVWGVVNSAARAGESLTG